MKKRYKIKKAIAISSVVLLMTLVFTQAVSAAPSVVTGKPTALGAYDDGHALVTLDTNGDGDGDWEMDLHMDQCHYDDIKDAKRDGKRVKITYKLKGGNYTITGVQILNNVNQHFFDYHYLCNLASLNGISLDDLQIALIKLMGMKKMSDDIITTPR